MTAPPLPVAPLHRLFPGIETVRPRYHALTDDYREMMTAVELDALCRMAAYWNPDRLFELGTYLGGSALQLAANTDAEVHTLDLPPKDAEKPIWDEEIDVYPDEPGRKFHGTPFEGRIHQIYGDSQTYDYTEHLGRYGMAFVDACHHYEFVKVDSANALRVVRPGGLVVWHDYADYAPGVVQALDELAEKETLWHLEGTSLVVHFVSRFRDAAEPPAFASVIVPTRNRGPALSDALESLVGQDYPADRFEILAVDNGSTDDTKAVIEAAQAAHPGCALRYVLEPEPGLLSGRHRGASEAQGSILVFVDDDIVAHPHWLAEVVAGFDDPDVHCVGGRSHALYKGEPPAWIERFWARRDDERWLGYLSLIDLGERSKDVDPMFVWGLNFAVRKSTFFDVGGTHPDCIPKSLQRYQGDGETGLSLRLKARGLKARYQPGARVWHVIEPRRMTVKAWEERQFYQGVCDSFARLRENGGEPTGPFKAPWSWPRCPFSRSRRAIRRRLERAQQRGFAFHQREVAGDPALREWVLRDDYLDYRLPEGWRRYLGESS
jgi:GT2 family glycosyltransferase